MLVLGPKNLELPIPYGRLCELSLQLRLLEASPQVEFLELPGPDQERMLESLSSSHFSLALTHGHRHGRGRLEGAERGGLRCDGHYWQSQLLMPIREWRWQRGNLIGRMVGSRGWLRIVTIAAIMHRLRHLRRGCCDFELRFQCSDFLPVELGVKSGCSQCTLLLATLGKKLLLLA